ncbi:MAG: hypothetical protein LBJ78_04240 [Puniceicoccales bacterium]|jgi:hypothetical protein|nr:hypothetical protein [Puniceicoccales bacterium]
MGSFLKKKYACLLAITMIEVNAVWAMPTIYTDWKKEAQKVLPGPLQDQFLSADIVTKQCLVLHTKMWANVCMEHCRGNWVNTLPTMCTLCTLGYFLVQGNLINRGNALEGVEYVLDLLDSDATPESQVTWKAKFEEIQQALLAIEFPLQQSPQMP